MYVSLSLIPTFLLFIFAAIGTATAVYEVDPLVYEVKHSEYFGTNRLACGLEPSYFETIVVNNCYNNYQLFTDTNVNLVMREYSFHFFDSFSPSLSFRF